MPDSATTTWPLEQIKPFLDYLLIECGLADNTIYAYSRDLRRFADFCLQQHIDTARSVTPIVVQQFARELSQGYLATATIARHLVTVRMFMRFHLLFRLVDQDVCSSLETPKTWKRLPKVLSKSRTIELIESADPDDPLYLRNRALLELLYATGMRASEAADLELDQINFQIGYLRCIGKGRKERIIPVHNIALEALRQYIDLLRPQLLGMSQASRLFVSRTGRPLTRIDVWRIVRRAARAAGMTGLVSPHTLRHCFGSHLLQGGADLRSVQEMLGHSDVTTTQIYTHVDHEHIRSMHKKYHPRP